MTLLCSNRVRSLPSVAATALLSKSVFLHTLPIDGKDQAIEKAPSAGRRFLLQICPTARGMLRLHCFV